MGSGLEHSGFLQRVRAGVCERVCAGGGEREEGRVKSQAPCSSGPFIAGSGQARGMALCTPHPHGPATGRGSVAGTSRDRYRRPAPLVPSRHRVRGALPAANSWVWGQNQRS